MATDARGKTVPASTDHPARAALLGLALSVRDPIPVATSAARSAALSTLAGLSPAILPSTSNPIYFNQADLPLGYRTLYTVDGLNFISASGAFVWANDAARTAATTMAAGDKGYQVDTKAEYMYSGTAWVANPVSCALRKSAPQNLTASATALVLDVEISDNSGMHDNVTNNTRITAVLPGLYEFVASVYNSNTSGMGTLYARLNGTTDIAGSLDRRTADPTGALPLRIVFPQVLAVGDYVEIMVLHATAAGNISGGTSTGAAVVTAKRIGPA